MIRSWVRQPTVKVSSRIQKANVSSFYILQELGPTGFLLKSENQKWKVLIGSNHSCNCPHFQSKRDACIHILWVLLKVFQISADSELIFQTGLIEREIIEIIQERGKIINITPKEDTDQKKIVDVNKGIVARPITESDICPICQESLQSSNLTLTHCRLGCGNNIHLKCIKVLMDHQIGSMGFQMVKCPLCRCDFNTVEGLQIEIQNSCNSQKKSYRQPIQHGISCSNCKKDPVLGKYHKCIACKNLYLCDDCFKNGSHDQHTFQNRVFRNSKWIPSSRNVAPVLPSGFINELQNRDITDEDYQTLILLDSGLSKQASIPLHIINSFPLSKYSSHKSGKCEKCKICGELYNIGAMTRKIPCSHSFHQSCIDRWLLNQRATCPICGLAAYSAIEDDGEDNIKQETMFIAKKYEKSIKPLKKIINVEKTAIAPQNLIEIIGTGTSKVTKCFESSFNSALVLASWPKVSSRRSLIHEKKSKGKEPLESFIVVQSISPLLTFSSANMKKKINVVNKNI